MNKEGDAAIETLITNWDKYSYHQCIIEESEACCELFKNLKNQLESTDLDSDYKDSLLISSIQEFERRAAQKRKTRAGESLEDSVEVLMKYLNIQGYSPEKTLITGTMEADGVIRHNNYKCLISCKRTGRERVKQLSFEESELQKFRIRKIIWFLVEFDQTESRVIDLGVRGAVFYLPDSSKEYQTLSKNRDTSPYVFPLSKIRESLPKLVSGEI